MTDITSAAVDLLRATHQGDAIGYARVTNRVRRTQTGPAVTRELAELFLDMLRGTVGGDDAIQKWLDEFAREWLRIRDVDV